MRRTRLKDFGVSEQRAAGEFKGSYDALSVLICFEFESPGRNIGYGLKVTSGKGFRLVEGSNIANKILLEFWKLITFEECLDWKPIFFLKVI